MFGSIGLALGAVSTISSLLETAAAGINQAAGAPLGGTQPANGQTFSPAPAPVTTQARTYGVTNQTSVVLPKFAQHAQATLLAYQEMHRG